MLNGSAGLNTDWTTVTGMSWAPSEFHAFLHSSGNMNLFVDFFIQGKNIYSCSRGQKLERRFTTTITTFFVFTKYYLKRESNWKIYLCSFGSMERCMKLTSIESECSCIISILFLYSKFFKSFRWPRMKGSHHSQDWALIGPKSPSLWLLFSAGNDE